MLNVFLLYPPNDFSYVDSFVNQEFFDSLIIIMNDVHLTFLCNNRNVNKKLVTHQRQYTYLQKIVFKSF